MDVPSLLPHCAAMGKRPTGDPSTLDAPRRALWDAAESQRVDLANLSKQIGRNHAYLRQYLWRRSPAKLDEDDRDKLAKILSVDAEYLKVGAKPQGDANPVDNNQRKVEPETIPGLQFSEGARSHLTWPKNLPILGHARAGVEGFFLEQGERHGMAFRPPALSTVKDAFAVYVHDDCMSPKFEPGEIAWIHPTRPVAPGNHVIIELADGQAFIKRLVRRTGSHVICLQYEPRKEIRFDIKKVKRLYYVVGSYREE